MNLVVRKLELTDIQRVLEIDKESFKVPLSADEIDMLKVEASTTLEGRLPGELVVEKDGEVIGYCLWCCTDKWSTRIDRIAVAKKHRHKGAGKEMVDYIFSAYPHMEKVYLTAIVHASKLDAQIFFKVCGFLGSDYNDNVKFVRSVPLDNLSDRHIASIAKRKARKR